MSTHAHANAVQGHDPHQQGSHGGAGHVPHVLPLGVYFKTYFSLLILTAITFGASYLHLGDVGGLIVAMAIATVKAALVCVFFMHLLWDKKFNAVLFLTSVLFLILFLSMTLPAPVTMSL